MKLPTKRALTLACSCLCLIAFTQTASAKRSQDCLVEGEIQRSELNGQQSRVYISFHKIKPFSRQSRCNVRGDVAFEQPEGTSIETLPAGSTVQYRYQENKGQGQWSFVSASR